MTIAMNTRSPIITIVPVLLSANVILEQIMEYIHKYKHIPSQQHKSIKGKSRITLVAELLDQEKEICRT